ncbi:MAG: hypothetical protein IMW89_21390 [Ktedonobacteraceae bacterium]|nr:hypothetical protein [Ktedonobacteraceae bacterium]
MTNILIASLGESPVVVTAIYDLLTSQSRERERLTIDKVIVLHPKDGSNLIDLGYDCIEQALRGKCAVESVPLPFADANTEERCFEFLRCLAALLNECQKSGDTVYFSLAGGRKNMSALMAVLVPLFPCVKKLYHLIDKDEVSRRHNFKSLEELIDLPEDDRYLYLFPEHERLKLVDIPYAERQQVSDEFRSLFFTITVEGLADLGEQNPVQAELMGTYQSIVQGTSLLKIRLTRRASEEYQRMCKRDVNHAREFMKCFKQMMYPYNLQKNQEERGIIPGGLHPFSFFKRRRTVERPFYHTEPYPISHFPKKKVDTVIISGLVVKQEGVYEPTGEELAQSYDPKEPTFPLESVCPSLFDFSETAKSVLLVPLGTTPMIATQLYTLLTAQGRETNEVVLIYPAGLLKVRNSARLAQKAFEQENVSCKVIDIPELKDIDSREACEIYERRLEDAIDDIRRQHPGCQIELALSGGRKGMAALAMFVAQRKGIPYLYHTLVAEELERRVSEETSVEKLGVGSIDDQRRNDLLFLRAYEGNGPYTKFSLFRVPVLPPGEKSDGK